MEDKLKPCPFCRGEASIYHGDSTDGYIKGTSYVMAFCDWCGASIRGKNEDEVIKKWNNRPSPWHTGTPSENGWYLLECNIGNSDGTYYATDYWNNEVGYWTVNRVIRWQKIEEDKED